MKAEPASYPDKPLFAILYSIALYELMDHSQEQKNEYAILGKLEDPGYPDRPFKVGMADFLKKTSRAKPDKRAARRAVERIRKFLPLSGVVNGVEYPALSYADYDEKQNTLTFASPYINKVIMEIARTNASRGQEAGNR